MDTRSCVSARIGILALQVLFSLVTLPVEFNASRKAIPLLEQRQMIVLEGEPGSA
jgi:Zn-dependent membrane protease YugP